LGKRTSESRNMVEAVKADYAAAKKRGIGARRLNAEFGHSDDSS